MEGKRCKMAGATNRSIEGEENVDWEIKIIK